MHCICDFNRQYKNELEHPHSLCYCLYLLDLCLMNYVHVYFFKIMNLL